MSVCYQITGPMTSVQLGISYNDVALAKLGVTHFFLAGFMQIPRLAVEDSGEGTRLQQD